MSDEDDPEDISLTAKQTAKIEKKKADNARTNPSNTIPIVCPDCACDYFIPMMRGFFTKSFAGNRMMINWPSRTEGNDTALVACPSCYIVYSVKEDGTFVKTGKSLKAK